MNSLIIFTRYPEPGKTKTRLIPALGADGAANLQRKMTEQTVTKVRQLSNRLNLSIEIRFAGGNYQLMAGWLGSGLRYQEQGEGNLGKRMARAFQTAFDAGIKEVVTIGIDCPGLNGEIIEHAFAELEGYDLVLGPAVDGGYYLIGLSVFVAQLFEGVNWGTAEVLAKTVAIAESLNLSVAYLPPLSDIDRPEDLSILDFKF